MKNKTKVWLIIAASLVLVGCIVFWGLMSTLGWDFERLSTENYEKNTYEIDQEFNNISIKGDTADIIFELSEDEKCRVECYEEENARHNVVAENDSLIIELIDQKSSLADFHFINFDSPKIKVYLPKTEYTSLIVGKSTGDVTIPKEFSFEKVDISLSTGDVSIFASVTELVKIKSSTGDVYAENIAVGTLDLSASTGKVMLKNVECKTLTSSADTGDISLKNVIVKEKLSIKRSTGDVRFEGSDAGEIYVVTDTGNVTGSLLSDKFFITETDTGSVNVPKTSKGGRCEITTDTGNIRISIE